MGEDQKYYDVEDYRRWKRNQGKAVKVAPRANLLAAAGWLRRFFDARSTNWAALGSLAMLCLGARREIPDIHIVYDDKEFQRIRMKLQTDPRVRMPKDINSMFSSKLLISTGPKFKDAGCTENADIEVEMIPPGSQGTPPSDILRSNQAMLSLNLDGKITNIKGLNIIYLVKTTVHLCTNQDLLWDPKKDLLWLCRKYGKEIQSIRGHLNARQVQENFLGTQYFSTLSVEEQRLCYHVLLGKDPPPSMFLTPAPQLTSARPPIPPHKSAPSLKDGMQQGSSFLRPPMLHKAKTAPGAPPNGPLKQASPQAAPISPKNDNDPAAARGSRSRYRNSSAPTTPSASRNVSPEAHPTKIIMEFRSDHMQQHSMIYQAQTINMQNLAPASKPQVVRTKKSLPRVNGQLATAHAVPVFAHKPSNTPAAPNDNAQSNSAVTPMQAEPKSRPQNLALKAHTNNSALSSTPSPPSAQPQVVAHAHPAHKIMAQRNSLIPISNNKTAASPAIPVMGDAKAETPSKSLAVVCAEGLYSTPPIYPVQPAKGQQGTPLIQNQAQNVSYSPVFELDASSPQVESFPSAAPANEFAAELPADNILLQPSPPIIQRSNSLPETPIRPPLPQGLANLIFTPGYSDSPVSPPTTSRPLDLLVQPLKPEPLAQAPTMASPPEAPKLVPMPPSFDSLPPSLTIGFRGPQPHAPIHTAPRPRASSQSSNGSNTPAAFSKYQRYYSPPGSRDSSPNSGPPSASTSRQPSPRQGPVYKAYTPPITPPMPPKMEPSQTQPPPTVHNPAFTPSAPMPTAAPVPMESAPIPMDRASRFLDQTSPPNILRAGANLPPPLKPAKASQLPNPLAANPPTPRTASHAKHDSHQGSESRASPLALGAPLRHHKQMPVASSPPSGIYTHASSQLAQQPQPQPQYIAFSAQHAPPPQPRHQSSAHQRSVSAESNSSTTSHDSEKLAQEYQMDLPSYGNGYGAQPKSIQPETEVDAEVKKSYRPSYGGTGYGEQFRLDLHLDLEKEGSGQGDFMDGYVFR